jgi:hypothetical protein
MLAGDQCACLDGFTGLITWNAIVASGECHPARCNVHDSNLEDGLRCKCKDNYVGSVQWNGSVSYGHCSLTYCANLTEQAPCEKRGDCEWDVNDWSCEDVACPEILQEVNCLPHRCDWDGTRRVPCADIDCAALDEMSCASKTPCYWSAEESKCDKTCSAFSDEQGCVNAGTHCKFDGENMACVPA